MTGAQNVEPAWPAFISARASCPICRPVSCQSVRLKDMPVVMGKGNLVVWWPLLTPLEASSHQLYLSSVESTQEQEQERRARQREAHADTTE